MVSDAQVSVIIPAHNGEKYLGRAIDSVLAQSGVKVELIVVDDRSTDATADVARAYEAVRYVAMAERGGNAYVSTNVGLSHTRAQYVAVLHQDDLWRPHKLAHQIAVMDSDPRIGLSYSALSFIGADDEYLGTLRSPLGKGDHVVDGQIELRHLCVQNYINVCNAILRRAALDEAGHFPEQLWFTAEWAVWLRVAMRWRVGYVDRPLSCFRIHPQSQTQTRTRDTREFRSQLLAVLTELYARTDLSRPVRQRHRMSFANVELSTALQCLYWSDRRGALAALSRLARLVRPWEVPSLIRTSAVIPRSLARVRMSRHAPQR